MQQRTAFEMLAFYVKEKRNQMLQQNQQSIAFYNHLLEEILLANQKLEANVSFQNIAEQITLHVIFA